MTANKSSNLAKDLFTAFYEWSMTDAVAEAQNNFATIRGIPSITAYRFLERIDLLSAEESMLLIRGLVLRANSGRIPELKSLISPAQQMIVQKWLEPSIFLRLTRPQQEMYRKKEIGKLKIVNRRLLGEKAKNILVALSGKQPETWGGGVYRWSVPFGRYMVHTDLDIGAKSRQIGYFHSISDIGGEGFLIQNTSLLSWLGISGMTVWEFVDEETVEDFVQRFKVVLNRFLHAAPKIFGRAEDSRKEER